MQPYLDLVSGDYALPLSEDARQAALNAAKRVFTLESVSPLLAYSEWRAKRARQPFNAKLASLHDAAQEASRLALAAYGVISPSDLHLVVRPRPRTQ